MSLPVTHKAWILSEHYAQPVIHDLPTPKPGKGQILVKVKAAALNPIDWKLHKYDRYGYKYPMSFGHDLAGEVVGLGGGEEYFVVGDRVYAQGVHAIGEAGFHQYTLLPSKTTGKIPEGISYEGASTLPVVLVTALCGFYRPKPLGFGLEGPFGEGRGKYHGTPFVVLGGSGSLGQIVIQISKLAGFSPIITTASPHNAEDVKNLGAHFVVDRSLPEAELVAKTNEFAGKPIKYVFDAISTPETQHLGERILSPGGELVIVLPAEASSLPDGKSQFFVLGLSWLPENLEIAWKLYRDWTAELLPLLKLNRVEILPRGLHGVIGGFRRMELEQVSRSKLVVRPEETD